MSHPQAEFEASIKVVRNPRGSPTARGTAVRYSARIKPTGKSKAKAIKITSDCFEAFLAQMEPEIGKVGVKALREKAIEAVQAAVNTYEDKIAKGEVGATGSGSVANSKTEMPPDGTTILIYGKVQSGKTSITIAYAALAIANGFKLGIVLTSDNVWLGDQTARRFREGLSHGGPAIYSWDQWSADPKAFAINKVLPNLTDRGVILVSTKNKRNLENLKEVLKYAKAWRVPAKIFDDEADNATPDTNTAKRAAAGGKKVAPSSTFSQVGQIRKLVRNHVFVQVTATPQALLLQGLDHPLRPAHCVLWDPGHGYMGGDLFFREGSPHTGTIESDELEELRSGSAGTPAGLRLALSTFFLGFAQHYTPGSKTVYSFLCHVCHKKINHEHLSDVIGAFVREVDKSIRGRLGAKKEQEVLGWLQEAHDELAITCPELKPLKELVETLKMQLTNTDARIINADSNTKVPSYYPGMNILIGGNRFGRGVTPDGLMVTYYGRDAKQKQADTVHQHARMFGYRRKLLETTRLFVAPRILEAFRMIHEADEATRRAIETAAGGVLKVKPVWCGKGIKPTRANVLNPADIDIFHPGSQIYPHDPLYKRSKVKTATKKLDELLECYSDERDYYEVDIDFLVELLGHTKSRYTGGTWKDSRVIEALKSMKNIGITKARLNVRNKDGAGMRRDRKNSITGGFASGNWTDGARNYPNVPTLILMKQAGSKKLNWDGHPFYVPTLVFPDSKFIVAFSDKGV